MKKKILFVHDTDGKGLWLDAYVFVAFAGTDNQHAAGDETAIALIIRSAEGNLRLCRNLCCASLIKAARETKKIVSITHVNNVLVQPH